MAKIWRVKFGGETHYIPGEKCKSADAAAEKVGCRAGENCFVSTVFSPPGVSAEEWIAEQTAEVAPTKPEPTPTPAEPAKPTPTPTPTPTAPTPTAPTTPEEAFAGFVAGGAVAGEAPPSKYTDEQLDDYEYYLAARELYPNLPEVKDIEDFLAQRADIEANWDDYVRGYTEEDVRGFNVFKKYASLVGAPDDWRATNIEDYLENYETAQQQLAIWQKEWEVDEALRLEKEAAALSPEEAARRREERYAREQELIEYGLTPEEAARRREERYAREREIIEHAIEPEEAARRREESYAEARYAAQERYKEPPEYTGTAAQWMTRQQDFSQALRGFVEKELPSLQAEFRAEQGPLPGFATREEAREEQSRRERAYRAWLPERMAGVEEEFYAQRPAQRGERYHIQAPVTRFAGW